MKLARVFTAISLVLLVGFDFNANAIAIAPSIADWNGDVFYKKSDGSPEPVECEQKNVRIRPLKNRVYADVPITSMQNVCVYTADGYEYAWYRRCYYEDPHYPVIGCLNEDGIAFSVAGNDFVPAPNLTVRGSSDIYYLGHTKSFVHVRGRNSQLIFYKDIVSHMSDLGQEGLYLDDNVDFMLTDENNIPVITNGLGISMNKQWISFAVPNSGVMVMNLATLKPQRLTNDYAVDRVSSPSVYYETSVSSDGGYVLVSGSGLSTMIIQNFDGCGEFVSTVQYSDDGKNTPIIGTECQRVYLDSQLRQRDFVLRMPGMAISNAKISGKGDSFYYFNNYYWSNVYAANYDSSTLAYLALGDSYASGEGDLTDDYLPYTNIYGDYRIGVVREMCHISRGSYPFLLAKDMGLQQGLDMQSVACSGAVLRDVFSADKPIYFTDTQYAGQPTQLQKGVGDRLGGLSNQLQLQQEARSSFIPGRVQQIEFVHATQPSTLTLMMGGNDLGFGGIMASCAKTIKLTQLDQTCDELTQKAG